uniref:Pre-mRNA-processing protein 40A n=1 Tax=Rhizophora mucronata TaxID=61149 RepID=A0A2P2MEN8_RHIMU
MKSQDCRNFLYSATFRLCSSAALSFSWIINECINKKKRRITIMESLISATHLTCERLL